MTNKMTEEVRPLCVLIAALGGEGGGVLADWVAEAARREGFTVQSTSIPGVAQRTGATTYYIEIARGDRVGPPLALTPMPSNVDLVVASELVEAARAVQHGYITPNRTTVVASTHRVYATSEKSHKADGRFDTKGSLKALTTLAQRAVLFDLDLTTQKAGSVISAVMCGAVAGSGALPIAKETFISVITDSGIAVASNLKGFELAFSIASGSAAEPTRSAKKRPESRVSKIEEVVSKVRSVFPAESMSIVEEGVKRLIDYQDARYATLFTKRLEPLCTLAASRKSRYGELVSEAARNLALRMSFEDIIRVADLKTRRSRVERVRAEAGAKPEQPVVITEYFKPGLDEICGVLPYKLGSRLAAWAERTGRTHRFNVGVHLRTTAVSGFFLLWFVAKLRFMRRSGYRYRSEQRNIDRWLDLVAKASAISNDFALEVVECARLIKGYGDTHKRGSTNFDLIVRNIIEPAIEQKRDASEKTRIARERALSSSEAKDDTPTSSALKRESLADVKPIAWVTK